MRLWTVHPRYLDAKGLVALWREALLAQAVIRGRTRGYRHHPQLHRFLDCPFPRSAINLYLARVYDEAASRGYSFDKAKLARIGHVPTIVATHGQLLFEWDVLLRKLRERDPQAYRRIRSIAVPDAHPMFDVMPGPISDWERARSKRERATLRSIPARSDAKVMTQSRGRNS